MLRELVSKIIKKRTVWVLFYAALITFGFHALFRISVEVLPRFDFPRVNIIAHWPGASAHELEVSVTRPIESRLLALPQLENLRSAMGQGVVHLTARFRNGTHAEQDLQAVNTAIDRAKSRLPVGVSPYAEVMGNAINEVADYAVDIPNDLERYHIRLRVQGRVVPALRGLRGVQRVEIIGGGQPSLWVQPIPSALMQADVTLPGLAKSLKNHLVLSPAGYFNWGHQQVLASVRDMPDTVRALSKWYVRSAANKSVPLSSIADIQLTSAPALHDVFLNGKPSLYLVILKQQGASTETVDREIGNALHHLQSSLPPGVRFVPIYRQAHVLRLIGSDLGRNLLVGGALAILVMAFFLGMGREVWILALTIPISLLTAIALLFASGQTLNLITLGALTVAVGLLADDAIIVLESIVHEWEAGHVGIDGIRRGLSVIALADITGTMTTVAVFLPFLLIGGLAGIFTIPFAIAMVGALAASLFVSLTLVPLLLRQVGKVPNKKAFRSKGNRGLVHIRNANLRLFELILRKPRLSLALIAVFVGISFAALILLPVNFLPLPNEGVLLDSFVLPPGTALPKVKTVVRQMSLRMLRDPDVSNVLARIGSPASSTYFEHSNSGEIQIVLKRGLHASRLDYLARRLKREAQLPGVEQSFDTPTIERVGESLTGLPQPFAIRIEGPSVSMLETLTRKAAQRLAKSASFSSLFANDAFPVNQLNIKPRAGALAGYGISSGALSTTLRLALAGAVIGRIPHGDTHINLYMRLKDPQRIATDQLKRLPIHLTGDRVVPLSALAKLRMRVGPSVLRHINGARMLEITGQPSGSFNAAASAARRILDGIHFPTGYRFEIGGLYPQFERTLEALAAVAIAALVLMVGILLIHFDGWVAPLLVLLEVPLAFGGGAASLAASGIGLNLLGIVGFITLIGISLNHAIVLLDRVKRNELAGHTLEQAVREAVQVRFRPILLTTLTAVLGALPTAAGWGVGAAPEQGLAIVLVGGMLWTALLSTNLIPALYLHYQREKRS